MSVDRYLSILKEITKGGTYSNGDNIAAAILSVGEILSLKCSETPSGTMSSDDDSVTIISNESPKIPDKIERY